MLKTGYFVFALVVLYTLLRLFDVAYHSAGNCVMILVCLVILWDYVSHNPRPRIRKRM